MASLRQDVTFGLRMLGKSPGVSAIAILSLALAIGANTAIFTVWNAVMWQSVAVPEASRVVNLYTQDATGGATSNGPYFSLSFPNYQDYAKDTSVFSGLVAYFDLPATMTVHGQTNQVAVEMATGNYFQVLGLSASPGRVFTAAETANSGQGALAVLSYPFWNRHFGSDRAIIGQTINLNGQAFLVVGVAPADFTGTQRLAAPDLWVPMSQHDVLLTGQFKQYFSERRPRIFNAFGRLAPGISLAQAQAAITVTARGLQRQYPADNLGQTAAIITLPQSQLNPNLRRNFSLALLMMLAVVGLVLLIACANVANLLLARGMARHREIAVRLAMGASRARLVRQLLVESMVMALAAGGIGVLLASLGCDLLWAHRPPQFQPNATGLSLDAHVLWFTLAVSLATGIIFGLAPALHATRMDLITQLKERSQPALSGQRPWSLRGMLLIGEVAFSLVALIVAGLFLTSLRRTQGTDPGFDVAHLASLRYDLGAAGVDLTRPGAALEIAQRNRELLASVRALPGVVDATIATGTPMAAGSFARSYVVAGHPLPPGRAKQFITVEGISPDSFFSTTGIPLLAGRDFTDRDTADSQKVVIVNQTAAHLLFPGVSAVGQRLQFTGDTDFTQVVGVARDSKYFSLSEDPSPFAYLPLSQWPQTAFGLTVRSAGSPATILTALRAAVHDWMPNLAVTRLEAASVPIQRSLWLAEMGATLLASLAALALLLAAIGVYGVMSYGVRQRSRELGIRMALGASSRNIFVHVLGGGMLLVAIGIALGLLGAFGSAEFIATLLYGVRATDPVTFTAYSLLFLAVATLAGFLPARRATRIPPAITLRND